MINDEFNISESCLSFNKHGISEIITFTEKNNEKRKYTYCLKVVKENGKLKIEANLLEGENVPKIIEEYIKNIIDYYLYYILDCMKEQLERLKNE